MTAGIQQLERYELHNRIAVGGMAEVYLAKAYGAHGFEKTLAVKRILPELASNPEFQERFITEAKLAVNLSHANIVQVFDFGRVGPTLFLVLEYVDGLDLAALLSRYRAARRQVPLQAAFQIAIELARGLDYAHQRGVIHRDVSPSNILLSKAGDVKIADFGIAVPDASQYRQPSRRGRIMGKWRYMSPEQTRGEDLTTRSDLFSTASVMYELFTGGKLFPGEEPEEIIEQIHDMEIPSVLERRADLPPRLDAVLRRALARDPAERPARAADLQRTLTEISYESSIMCTAMEVADAVVAVLTPSELASGERGAAPLVIDDVIRQHLGVEAADAGRRTAAHTEPNAPGGPDEPGEPGEREDTSDTIVLNRLAEQRPATIVKTGVSRGGVEVWKVGDAASASRRGARRGVMPVVLALALAASVATVLVWQGRQTFVTAAAAVIDAGVRLDWTGAPDAGVARTELLVVVSTPSGAEVWIDDAQQERLTPNAYEVTADQPHRIEIRYPGYEPYVQEALSVTPGGSAPLEAALVPLRVALIVESEPAGATVRLHDRKLGDTPLRTQIALGELTSLRPGALTLSKQGYRTESVDDVESFADVAQRPGEPVRIARNLQRVARVPPVTQPPNGQGVVRIHMDTTWADVYLGTRRVGQVPGELSLPVGKHRLRLHNPVSQRTWNLAVAVAVDQPSYYRVPE
jgi:tRNA A-37 threonylcarbamoyl transferase component Bud32